MVLENEDIRRNFGDYVELPGGVLKFKDVVPALSYIYYLANDARNRRNVLAVAQDVEDDMLAGLLLRAGCEAPVARSALRKCALDPGSEGSFTHMLLAPPEYHSYFKGRIDKERADLFLALPVFRCEFSGDESVDLFYQLRREVVPTLDWRRSPSPKAMVRFDNPKTGGGTVGSTPVPFKYAVLAEEIHNLEGVSSGFIEVTSYRGDSVEVLSHAPGTFVFRPQNQRPGTELGYVEVVEELSRFLTR